MHLRLRVLSIPYNGAVLIIFKTLKDFVRLVLMLIYSLLL